MSPTISIPATVFTRLQALGGGLFSVPEVIERLLESARPNGAGIGEPDSGSRDEPRGRDSLLALRTPRERGATVEIDGQRIHAGTVSDLYQQVFRLILQKGKSNARKGSRSTPDEQSALPLRSRPAAPKWQGVLRRYHRRALPY